MAIYFYYTGETYGAFSGWSPHGFELDGHYWQTLEHFYQAQKFAGTPHAEEIRLAPTPRKAKQLGSRTDWPLRADWEAVKDAVMYRGVMAKIVSHPDVCALLMSTGDEELVENSRTDFYWGCGADGTGQNKLGKTYMAVRDALRAAREAAAGAAGE